VVEVSVMAFLAVAPSLVLALQGLSDPEDIDLEIGVVELLASLLAALGPAAMAAYLLWRDGRLRDAGFERRPLDFVAGYGVLGWVCTFIAFYSAATVLFIVTQAVGGDPFETTDESTLDLTLRTALTGLAVAVTAGIGEEIVFRAYAITRLEEAGFPRAAIWAPWAVFTAVHLYQGPEAVLVIGAVAFVFVWLFRWKRSVWPVMVAHTLYDVTILLLAALAGG
jgi:membrane protease YdiL (CAAX protease family)